MSLTDKIRGLLKLPKPEILILWILAGVAGWAVLEELARWLARP
jgi:hypothetical protein